LRPTKPRSAFSRFAKWTARAAGRPFTFVLAALVILVWAVTGPLFGFSDTWQLVINTGTTIITFLMVFLIQSTQNRDAEAVQVKLDEIIRAIGNAKNELLDLEELEEKDLDEIRETYTEMAQKAREARSKDHAVKRGASSRTDMQARRRE
jgi:low affinity Fe/Cu permease